MAFTSLVTVGTDPCQQGLPAEGPIGENDRVAIAWVSDQCVLDLNQPVAVRRSDAMQQ